MWETLRASQQVMPHKNNGSYTRHQRPITQLSFADITTEKKRKVGLKKKTKHVANLEFREVACAQGRA